MRPAATERAARLLEAQAGLQLEGSGRARLDRALREASGAAGLDPDRYVEGLAPGSERLADLVDRVTLQETSWFRDPAWWELLERTLLPDAAQAHAEGGGRGPLVLWSAGCATGEEAYSLAIACAEAGVPDWRVIGTDVSRRAVAQADEGRYGERALRGLSAARRDRWLVRDGGAWRVRDELRRHVDIRHDNLARGVAPVRDGRCGLVLCRYVLIYLAQEDARGLLDRIAHVLAPGGRLLVGAAESLWHISDRFAVEALEGAFAYRRRDEAAPRRLPALPPAQVAAPPPTPPPPRRAVAAAAERSTPDESRRLLADGERAIAEGDVEAAVAAFRGAAYLDPVNPLAHLQLGLALERAEDPGARRAFRAAWSALGAIDPATLRESLGGYKAEELVHLVAAKLEAS